MNQSRKPYSRQRKPKARNPVARKYVRGKVLKEKFDHFIEYHPASRLSRNLRSMLIDFLLFEGAVESSYLEDLLYDLQGLFDLLEEIQAQTPSESV